MQFWTHESKLHQIAPLIAPVCGGLRCNFQRPQQQLHGSNMFDIFPGAPFTNFNDGEGGGGWGGPTEVHILYPKRPQLQYLSTQKNHYFFLAYPKKIPWFSFRNPNKSLRFLSRPRKIPASFIDPKKSPLAKILDPKKSLGPPPPLRH